MFATGQNSERRDRYIYSAGIRRSQVGLWRSPPSQASPPIVPFLPLELDLSSSRLSFIRDRHRDRVGVGPVKQRSRFARSSSLVIPGIPIPRCYDFFFPIFFGCGGLPLGHFLCAAPAAVASHPSVARNVSCRTIDGVSQPTFVGVVRRRYLTDRSAPAAWDMGALGWASFHVRRLTGLG